MQSRKRELQNLSEEQLKQGYRVACQTFVNGDISVAWQPELAIQHKTSPTKLPSPESNPKFFASVWDS